MFSIFIAVLIFFFTFVLQLVTVRILRRLHIHSFFSFLIYIVGLIFVILFLFWGDFFYTSVLIYILLALLLMTNSLPLLGLYSPSSVIVTILSKEKKATVTQLRQAFDEKELIFRRLDDLVDIGLVQRLGSKYTISPK